MNNKLNITDLDLNFTKHPLSRDVSVKIGEDAIKQSLKNIILYNLLEKPFNIGLNLNIREYLFENFDIFYEQQLKEQILKIVALYESRVTINNIDITFDEKTLGLNITINYTIIGQEQIDQDLNIRLERTR
jgi:hypothetical protein